MLGTPTGLLAAQGDDEHGRLIRSVLQSLDVSTSAIHVSAENTTSVSHVIVDDTGERAILMAPASTSTLDDATMERLFGSAVREGAAAGMLTTEISQLPLSGVRWMLERARELGVPSCLDVDVPVGVATNDARLGTAAELAEVVCLPTVLKMTDAAADSVFRLISEGEPLAHGSAEAAARQIASAAGVGACVMTSGRKGSAIALGDGTTAVTVPPFAGVRQEDATGAGDAYFGGVVAWVHAEGLPRSVKGLRAMGKVASAAGAACCEVMGALPVPGRSAERMVELHPEAAALIERHPVPLRAPPKAAVATPAGEAAAGAGPVAASAPGHSEDAAGAGPSWLDGLGPEELAAFGSLMSDYETAFEMYREYREDGTAAGGGALVRQVVALAEEVAACATSAEGGRQLQVTGVGKSGAVARRLMISLRSVGVRASYVHGSEWGHGDIGGVGRGDVVVALSHSGNTSELVGLASQLRARGARYWGVVGQADSSMGRVCDGVVLAPATQELMGAVPSRSVVAQEMLSNALVSVVAKRLGVDAATFQRNHPAGAIGAAARRTGAEKRSK